VSDLLWKGTHLTAAAFYMWVPIVASRATGSLAWRCHYGTLLLVHRDWTSRSDTRAMWRGMCFQSRYEWCRASNQILDDQIGVLRLPLIHLQSLKQIMWFAEGKTTTSGHVTTSAANMALRPQPPYLLQGVEKMGGLQTPKFAPTVERLKNPSAVGGFNGLHNVCMREWISHAAPWSGMLAGLLSPHAASKDEKDEQGAEQLDQNGPATDVDPNNGATNADPNGDVERGRPSKRRRKQPSQQTADGDAEDEDTHDEILGVSTRQTQLNFSSQPSRSVQRPWPERNLHKKNMSKIKDWLINVRRYENGTRGWHWNRVERAAREENRLINAP
jgi:hypothetical protein